MTTTILNVSGAANETAFRLWGKGLSDAIVAAGLVRTADTGQINWATVTMPGPNSYAGYEIFRFNDAIQATSPLFIKIEFGVATSSAAQIRTQFGKGSTGAGVLTSTFGAQIVQTTSNQITAISQSFISGDGSTLSIAMWPTVSSWPFFLYIERSRSNTGVPTGTAFSVTFNSGGSSPQCRFYHYASMTQYAVGSFRSCCGMPSDGAPGLAGGAQAPVFLGLFTDGQGTYWQPRGICYYVTVDAGSYAPVTVQGYGTYMPLGQFSTGSTAISIMMQWS